MRSTIDKISSAILYVLMGLCVVVIAFFYAGGSVDPAADMQEPVYTDLMLYCMYALLGLGIVVTLGFSLYSFCLKLKDSPKDAIKQIVVIIGIVAIFAAAWMLGDDTPLNLPGYDGNQNVTFWLKLTDMFYYVAYLLLGTAIVSILGFNVKKMIKK